MKLSRGLFLFPLAALALLASVARAAEPELSFAVIGDWGKGTPVQREAATGLARVAESIHARFIISTGDNFYPRGVKSASDPQWRTLFEEVYTAPSLSVPWWIVLGNHDHQGSTTAQIDYSKSSPRWRLPAPYYKHTESIDRETRADFFFLDTTPLYQASRWPWKLWPFENRQYSWLERELAASTASWKIVIGHHPVFSGGNTHGSTPVLVEKLKPLLEKYGVAAYLNGHSHALEHTVVNGVNYFTVGAGAESEKPDPIEGTRVVLGDVGFMAARLRPDLMSVEFVDRTGATIYRTEIQPSRQSAGPLVSKH